MVLGAFRQLIAATSWRQRDEQRPRAVLVTETRMDTYVSQIAPGEIVRGSGNGFEGYWHLARSL